MRNRWLVVLLLSSACKGSDGGSDGSIDAAPPDARLPDAALYDASFDPMTLRETGLYLDFASETLAPGVVEYTVNYPLWADGAAKRRFAHLPPGSTIDTSDMDFWHLPEGTKLWKEFTRDGVRVETRLIWKQGPSELDWYAMSFAWDAGGTEATAAPYGQIDALGTSHDIPQATDCQFCHVRMPGYALGLSALQLDHDDGDLNLPSLIADGRLSSPPSGGSAPIFPLPGSDVEKAAMGYLHGNCGPCHNENSDVQDKTPLIWNLDVGSLATVQGTTIYQHAVGVAPNIPLPGTGITSVIEPGNREASAAYFRMDQRFLNSQVPMPPLATQLRDVNGGLAAVGAWIDFLGQ